MQNPATLPIDQIWLSFQVPLHKFVLRQVKETALADDIVQEVFLRLLKNASRIKDQSNLKSYLYTTAKNAVMDHFRKAPQLPLPESIRGGESQASEYQLADCCLRPLIDSLPTIYQDALVKVELEGISQKDFAQQLGLSYSAAKSRVQRARQLLKEVILACCAYQFDRYGTVIGCCE